MRRKKRAAVAKWLTLMGWNKVVITMALAMIVGIGTITGEHWQLCQVEHKVCIDLPY